MCVWGGGGGACVRARAYVRASVQATLGECDGVCVSVCVSFTLMRCCAIDFCVNIYTFHAFVSLNDKAL